MTKRTEKTRKPRGMEAHDRLRIARQRAGFASPVEASRRFGWGEHTYKSHENGQRGIRPAQAQKYAKAFNVSTSWLLTGENAAARPLGVQTVPLLADAAGGVWLEYSGPLGGQEASESRVPVVPDPRFAPTTQYSRRVRGNSVSNRIRDGEFAIMVRFEDYAGAIPHGTLIDVSRHRGGLVEHSIKVYMGDHLMTDSAEMKTQSKLDMDSGEAEVSVLIEGIVIGVFRPL